VIATEGLDILRAVAGCCLYSLRLFGGSGLLHSLGFVQAVSTVAAETAIWLSSASPSYCKYRPVLGARGLVEALSETRCAQPLRG
jgi:hypothetical protein